MHRIRKLLAEEASKREAKLQRVLKRPKLRPKTVRKFDEHRPKAIRTDLDPKLCEIRFNRATKEAKAYWRSVFRAKKEKEKRDGTCHLLYSLQESLHMNSTGQNVETKTQRSRSSSRRGGRPGRGNDIEQSEKKEN